MKPFGAHTTSYRHGYSLAVCLSHLEGLRDGESETLNASGKGLRWKRMNLIDEAVAKLTEAYDMSEED